MKCSVFFLLLVLAGCSYASFAQNITLANNAFAQSILNGYRSHLIERHPTKENPTTLLNATFFGISPSIDSRISSLSGNEVIYATALEYDPVVSVQYASDDQKCAQEFGTHDAITYTLGSATRTIMFETNFRGVTTRWAVPAAQARAPLGLGKNELELSEFDPLAISMHALFEIPYEARVVSMRFNRDVDPASGAVSEGCDPRVEVERGTLTYEVTDSKNYTVESTKSLVRTVAPVLKEQWFRNNHFDSLVFSNRLFYRAQINNATAQWYIFDMAQDAFGYSTGVSTPYSNDTGMQHEEHVGMVSPYLLDRTNSSYGAAYLFNYSFFEQAGTHNMSILLVDHFGNNMTYNELLASRGIRTATAHELTESSFERPFTKEHTQAFGVFTLSIGALGLVFLLGALPRISSL